MYKAEFTNSFLKDFKKISRETQKEVSQKWIPKIRENPYIGKRFMGEKLHNFLKVAFRCAQNDYRIVYQLYNKSILIVFLAIGSRENFYKRLKNRL